MYYFLIVLLCFSFTVTHSFADIYTYTDENGVTCYTDTPLGKNAKRVIKEKVQSTDVQKTSEMDTKNRDYHSIINEKATVYNLDPSLIKAIIKTESNWDSTAISRKGAMGLMQLMPATAAAMNVRNPFDPEENIDGGTKYLRYLLEHFNGDLTLALAAYNAGPKIVEIYGCIPPYRETKQYVKEVLSHYNGKTKYPSIRDQNTTESIYKVILEDGTVLFTNSNLFAENPVRF